MSNRKAKPEQRFVRGPYSWIRPVLDVAKPDRDPVDRKMDDNLQAGGVCTHNQLQNSRIMVPSILSPTAAPLFLHNDSQPCRTLHQTHSH